MITRHWLLAAALGILAVATPLAAAVDITVRSAESGGVTTYAYLVHNATTQRIVAVRIGLDYLHGVGELRTPPVGWTPDGGLTAASTTAPQGWTPALISEEESEYFNLEWNSREDGSADIAPAASATFTVRVPTAATKYDAPQFDVVFGDVTHAYGVVQSAETRRRAVRH
jgi:hypothetical protein